MNVFFSSFSFRVIFQAEEEEEYKEGRRRRRRRRNKRRGRRLPRPPRHHLQPCATIHEVDHIHAPVDRSGGEELEKELGVRDVDAECP